MANASAVLMFVFWYCHKRGKEVRLAKEKEGTEGVVVEEDEDGEIEVEVTDEEGPEEEQEDEEAEGAAEDNQTEAGPGEKTENQSESKNDVPDQPEDSEVPVPDKDKGEKGAHLEATKSVGT